MVYYFEIKGWILYAILVSDFLSESICSVQIDAAPSKIDEALFSAELSGELLLGH